MLLTARGLASVIAGERTGIYDVTVRGELGVTIAEFRGTVRTGSPARWWPDA